jgi:hypothetical protein
MPTIPPTVPTVSLLLDRPRILCLDFNALAYIERVTGENVLKSEFWQDISATRLITLVHACLLREDPTVMELDVGGMIHSGNMDRVLKAVMKLYEITVEDESPIAAAAKVVRLTNKIKNGEAMLDPTKASR